MAADHPHARGENQLRSEENAEADGPSPRTWGERERGRVLHAHDGPSPRTWGEQSPEPGSRRAVRTIPTHVGRTFTPAIVRRRFGPSPRTWGELTASSRGLPWFRTIPTHVGRTHWFHVGRPPVRTIPTHVGRTSILGHDPKPIPDHSHARGENVAELCCRRLDAGPSPRTWGEPYRMLTTYIAERTIPTHVGRTNLRSRV